MDFVGKISAELRQSVPHPSGQLEAARDSGLSSSQATYRADDAGREQPALPRRPSGPDLDLSPAKPLHINKR